MYIHIWFSDGSKIEGRSISDDDSNNDTGVGHRNANFDSDSNWKNYLDKDINSQE
jgi:hypothetical protein